MSATCPVDVKKCAYLTSDGLSILRLVSSALLLVCQLLSCKMGDWKGEDHRSQDERTHVRGEHHLVRLLAFLVRLEGLMSFEGSPADDKEDSSDDGERE